MDTMSSPPDSAPSTLSAPGPTAPAPWADAIPKHSCACRISSSPAIWASASRSGGAPRCISSRAKREKLATDACSAWAARSHQAATAASTGCSSTVALQSPRRVVPAIRALPSMVNGRPQSPPVDAVQM